MFENQLTKLGSLRNSIVEKLRRIAKLELRLYQTPIRVPDPEREKWQHAAGVTGWRTALIVSPVWVSWAPLVRFGDGEFRKYNAAAGWDVGFMFPWLPPSWEVFIYDGVALNSIALGWFRINWARWPTDRDRERNSL